MSSKGSSRRAWWDKKSDIHVPVLREPNRPPIVVNVPDAIGRGDKVAPHLSQIAVAELSPVRPPFARK